MNNNLTTIIAERIADHLANEAEAAFGRTMFWCAIVTDIDGHKGKGRPTADSIHAALKVSHPTILIGKGALGNNLTWARNLLRGAKGTTVDQLLRDRNDERMAAGKAVVFGLKEAANLWGVAPRAKAVKADAEVEVEPTVEAEPTDDAPKTNAEKRQAILAILGSMDDYDEVMFIGVAVGHKLDEIGSKVDALV
jgi:hypothetical protein